MKACYVKYLSELINMVEKSRESILNNHNRFEEEIGDLAFLGDKRYGAYKAIVDTNEYRAAKTVEKIAVALLCERPTVFQLVFFYRIFRSADRNFSLNKSSFRENLSDKCSKTRKVFR